MRKDKIDELHNNEDKIVGEIKKELSLFSDIEIVIVTNWDSINIELKDKESTWSFADISFGHSRKSSDYRNKKLNEVTWETEFKIKGHIQAESAIDSLKVANNMMSLIAKTLSGEFERKYFDKYRLNTLAIDVLKKV